MSDLQHIGENSPDTQTSSRSNPGTGGGRQEIFAAGFVERVLLGPDGLRSGWSILLFAGTFYLMRGIIEGALLASGAVEKLNSASPVFMLLAETAALLSLIAAAGFMGLIEGRRIVDYNLAGLHRPAQFMAGLASGFLALSMLVAGLASGGWLRFRSGSLTGPRALYFAFLWACAFLVVGMVEEGLFRCYALFTLTRGINFWWALVAEISICGYARLNDAGHGVYGLYGAAALGLVPCLVLHMKSGHRSAFWQAAWVTSTFFCFYHTANGGENWIGIFAAALIGFVFCASVRLTGSAWWAIGCHATWDWAETYFYGTADSGMRGEGHLMTASPAGNPMWSGGTNGPEGSALVVGVILLLLLFLLVAYRRGKSRADAPQSSEAKTI